VDPPWTGEKKLRDEEYTSLIDKLCMNKSVVATAIVFLTPESFGNALKDALSRGLVYTVVSWFKVPRRTIGKSTSF
jgi:hypothetical protein